MKTEDAEERKEKKKSEFSTDIKSLRFRLTAAFIAFAIVLMGVLWLMQVFSLKSYYQRAIESKTQSGITRLRTAYAASEELDADAFTDALMDIARDSDIYIYIESESGLSAISSTELMSGGRVINGIAFLLDQARQQLLASGESETSFVQDFGETGKVIIRAAKLEGENREPVRLFIIAPLTPMDTTVSILTGLLFWVTIFSFILGALLAVVFSKSLAAPITDIKNKAKVLATGNYNVHFDDEHSYTEVRELARTLNETAYELERSTELQKDLVANVSHDLRTPLTMIKSYAEMIRDISGDNKEKRDQHLGVIIEETDRLSNLVGDILFISKIQSGTMEMKREPVDIQKAAESVLSVYKVLEDQDGFRFHFEPLAYETPIVTGDEARLQQVFSNLISNAVRYSADVKDITVRFSLDGGRLKCSVIDKGIGIAPEDLESIWNRYQRASKSATRSHASGTGLGLSIAKEILERHGADYGVESEVGKGSIFWFTIKAKFIVDSTIT